MTLDWFNTSYASLWQYAIHFIVDGFRYFVAFFGALFISLLLTPVCRDLAARVGMVDMPDARRINKVPIPRGGGLAIIIAFQVVLWLLIPMQHSAISQDFPLQKLTAFLVASIVLAVVGLIDDAKGLRPVVKLLGQILVASFLFFSGYHLGGVIVAFPPWFDYLATVFWIVGAINAFNLIDGLDGLATGLALIASVGMAGSLLFSGKSADTLPYIIFAGACVGFLKYNFHPASVFLGDTGSMFLGLLISTLPLLTGSRKELMASLVMPLLVMGVPIFDTFLAIWRRTVRHFLPESFVKKIKGGEEGVMQPDKDHLHHRLLRETMNNQRTVAITLYAFASVLVLVGLGSIVLKGRAPGLFFLAFVCATAIIVRNFECIELFDTGKLFSENMFHRRRYLFLPIAILIDIFLLCSIWLITWFLTIGPLTRELLLASVPMFVAPAFMSLAIGQIYRRVWSRAQVRDFIILAFCISMSSLASVGVVWIFQGTHYHLIRFSILYAALSTIALCAVRTWHECLITYLQIFGSRVLMYQKNVDRVLIYGGGLRLRGYLRELFERGESPKCLIIGIIDDDIQLKGRMIAGYHVLGTNADMENVIKKYHINKVVISCLMKEENVQKIASQLHALHTQVSIWSCKETPL